MFIADIRFPITTGTIITHLQEGLASWTGLSVLPKRPDPMPKRLIVIRDDGGTEVGYRNLNRYGGNVWADFSVDAENLARDAMRELRTLPGVGRFKAISQQFGPVEIEDDPAYTFQTKSLSHYYFTFAATVKGVA